VTLSYLWCQICSLFRYNYKHLSNITSDTGRDWFFLGLNIGLEKTELEYIQRETNGDAHQALLKMLTSWLQGGPCAPWEQLLDGLRRMDEEPAEQLKVQLSKGIM